MTTDTARITACRTAARGHSVSRIMACGALAAFCVLQLATALADDATDAAAVLAKAGFTKGVAYVPNCGAAGFTMELARQSSMTVMGQHTGGSQVEALRQSADQLQLLNRRIFAQQGPLSRVPLASNYADLIALTQIGGDLSLLPAAEAWRALCPNGKIISTASASAVQAWLDAGSVSATAVQDGAYAVVTKGMPAGTDNWTHWFRGPDGNPVSTDTVIRWPYMTQWLGTPFRGAQPNNTLVCNGRMFTFAGWNFDDDEYPRPKYGKLRVRNVYNGTRLWERELTNPFHAHRSCGVAMPEAFYLLDGRDVLALDPATGAELRRISFAGVTSGQAKWMAVDNGTLYALIGAEDAAIELGGKYDGEELTPSTDEANELPWVKGTQLVAYDLASNTTRWVHTETREIDARNVGVLNGKLFFHAPSDAGAPGTNGFAGCLTDLTAATPTLLWTRTDAQLDEFSGDYGHVLRRTNSGILCTPDAVCFFRKGRKYTVALKPSDGTLLWAKQTKGAGDLMRAMFIDGTIQMTNIIGTSGLSKLDPATGVSAGSYTPDATGCARYTASADAVYTGGGRGWDRTQAKASGPTGFKSNCYEGSIPANGLLMASPWTCGCNISTRGVSVVGPASGFDFYAASSESGRLDTFAGSSTVASFAATSADWPEYRANKERSMSAPTNVVATAPSQVWTYTPEASLEPTQPVAVGNSVFYAGNDGKVRCVNAKTGALQWSFATGGRIYAAPTVAADRVFVGSADGFIYALEAVSGRLLWRFRASPEDRRVMIYDDFVSTWAVNSGVIYHEGKVYAAAGITDWDNPRIFCLDAVTGAIIWENKESGHIDNEVGEAKANKGMAAQGGLTIGGGKLWLASGSQGSPACYDLATGAFSAPTFKMGQGAGLRGKDIGFYNGKQVVFGGLFLFRNTNDRLSARGTDIFFQEIDPATGARLDNEVAPFSKGLLLPAWDASITVATTRLVETLKCWKTPETSQRITDTKTTAEISRDNSLAAVYWQPDPTKETFDDTAAGLRLWSLASPTDIWGYAVAGNAVLVLKSNRSGLVWQTVWTLSALNRADGTVIWSYTLNKEPMMEGLCVNRDGNIMVSMRDGTILCLGQAPTASAPTLVTPPANAVVGTGQTTTLSVVATGSNLTYQWYADSGDAAWSIIGGATNSTYTTPSLSSTMRYRVVVRDDTGATAAATATVSVGAHASAPSITAQPAALTLVAGGEKTTLQVGASNAVSYQWYDAGTNQPIAGATGAVFVTPALTRSTVYRVRARNSAGFVDSALATVNVTPWTAFHDLSSLTDADHENITQGREINVAYSLKDIGSGGFLAATMTLYYSGTLAVGGSTTPSNPNSGTDAYNLFNGKISLGSIGTTRYTFMANAASYSTYTFAGLSPQQRYTVAVFGNANGTTSRWTKFTLQDASGFVSQTSAGVDDLADSNPATFKADLAMNNPGLVVKWANITPTGASGTSFNVKMTNTTSHFLPQAILLQAEPGPSITAHPVGATINSGGTATLSVTAQNAVSYQWYQGVSGDVSAPVAGATGSSFTTPALTADTSYWVRASGSGSVDSLAATVSILTDPFVAWGSSYGLSGGDAAAGADPDGDGIANLMEYALGLSPNQCSTSVTDGTANGLPLVAVEGADLTITYIRDSAKSDVTYSVQVSTDLAAWSAVSSGIVETALDGTRIRVKVSVPMGSDTRKFLRVVASRP